MLCGNSEVEQQAAMLGLEQPVWRNRLFSEILPGLGVALRPDVPYWPEVVGCQGHPREGSRLYRRCRDLDAFPRLRGHREPLHVGLK